MTAIGTVNMRRATSNGGFSLLELTAVVANIAVIAAIIVPRLIGHQAAASRSACQANQGDIELQAKLWWRNTGSYPAANLSNIGANASYFPSGLPTCPVDGSAYTISTTTGHVSGHTH
jgi:general secretion pathway protein G